MNPVLAQSVPGTGSGGDRPIIDFPTIDWSSLAPQLVNYFMNAFGNMVNDTLHSTFDGVWGTGSNVLQNTDLAMTWGFSPIADQVQQVQGAAKAVLVFALIVVGLRGVLSSIVSRQPDMLAEFINGVVVAVIMVAAFPLLIPQFIDFSNQAANAVGHANLAGYVSTVDVTNPLVQSMLFVILLFFALRLLIKAAWRIGFLAVLLPVGMLACALYALPQTRWILTWWVRVWGGMLLAQIPSVLALTIGAQLFAHGGGLATFVYSIAFLQLATDVYSLIPFGSPGADGGPPWALAWPAHIVLGNGKFALGGLGGVAGGAALAAGSVVGSAAHASVPTYGYQ
jgi:hypothetical protein